MPKSTNLSGDSTTLAGSTLSGIQADVLTTDNSLGLLDNLLTLSKDQLNVTWVGHVWVDLSCNISVKF